MRTIALVNQKGGVGKSTTAVNLGAGLARLGRRVLLIDLDPQAHSTVALGLEPRKLDTTIYSLLAGTASVKEAIRPISQGLSLIPANIHLAGGEAELAAIPNSALVLKKAMADLDPADYDYVIVDSPPQLGFLNVNSLAWVREVFIPMTCEFYALHGLSLLMETVERVKAKLNPLLRISGVITCMVHPRRAITRDVIAELEKHFPGRVLKTRIRVNVRLVEAPSHGKPIFDYAPDSNGAADYMSLAREMAELESPALTPAAADPIAAVFSPEAEVVAPEPAIEAPVPEPAVADRPMETVAEAAVSPEPESVAMEPAIEVPAPEPAIEPVVADAEFVPAPVLEAVAVAAEAASPETSGAPPVGEPVGSPFVAMDPGAPLTTPVAPVEAPVAVLPPRTLVDGSTPYAQMLGLAGLKPIVVARPGALVAPPPKKQGLFGRLMGRKD